MSNDSSPDRSENDDEQWDFLTQIPDAPRPPHDLRCDIWSAGMVLLCKWLDLPIPWPTLKIPQVIRKIISLERLQGSVAEKVARENQVSMERLKAMPSRLREIIDKCLEPTVDKRPTVRSILAEYFDTNEDLEQGLVEVARQQFPSLRLRCRDLTLNKGSVISAEEVEKEEKPLDVLSIHEAYYLWQLAGGDVFSELRKHGLVASSRPPVLSHPKLVLGEEGHALGERKERSSLYDSSVVIPLSLAQLEKCLETLTVDGCYPLIITEVDGERNGETCVEDETSKLPLVIKERDVKYQFLRIVLFKRLLQGYPYHKPLIKTEARVDVLPLYRAFIWAALLSVEGNTKGRYDCIDKDAWTPTDRQIEVDIPRCHQYDHLLASPEGHRKFKRILKAWVVTNPQYVYWQGLDSLCAPFLYLNFNNEALAFACLSAFVPKYLRGMFQRDNAAVIKEYLAKLAHLQAFHEPELYNHLSGIGFIPDLYAIPWILTMFAHVFPLRDIVHLWDKLLLGDSSFPLCIGLAILQQLRERLLSAEFNECILLFSDLPAIDIERCVKDSVRIFKATPSSLTWRKYGVDLSAEKNGASFRQLHIDSVTLEQQRVEKLPRMSGKELLELLGLLPVDSEDQSNSLPQSERKKPCVLVLDVRPLEEFKLGALPGSLHFPMSTAFDVVPDGCRDEGEDKKWRLSEEWRKKLALEKKGKVVCVVARVVSDAVDVSERLLESENMSRLCVLHNGTDVFKPLAAGVLCVPDA